MTRLLSGHCPSQMVDLPACSLAGARLHDLDDVAGVLASVQVWTALVLAASVVLWANGLSRAALTLIGADVSAEALTLLAKLVIGRPYPGLDVPHGAGDMLDALGMFPSGHAARTAVVVGVLLATPLCQKPMFRWAVTIGGWALLLVVGITRVAAEHHWPSDVLGGYLLGFACALLTVSVAERLSKKSLLSGCS